MCGASRRAPTRLPSTTRGHELQHPQPGHRRRARDRGDRRGAHLHEQRAAGRKGRAGARQGLRRRGRRAGRHAREGHHRARRPRSRRKSSRTTSSPACSPTTTGSSGTVLKQDLFTGQQVSSRRLRAGQRGRHDRRDPRHHARRQRRRQDLQRPRGHARTTATTSTSTRRIGTGNDALRHARCCTNVLVLKAQIGQKDTDRRRRRRAHPLRAQRPRRAEDALARRQRRRQLLAGTAPAGRRAQLAAVGRDPGDRARRRPPGSGPEAGQEPPRPGGSDVSERTHPHLHLRLVRRPGGGTPGALVALGHQGGRHGRRRSERRRPPARGAGRCPAPRLEPRRPPAHPGHPHAAVGQRRPDRDRDLGLHAGVPPGGARPRRAGRGHPAAADRVARLHAAPRARAQPQRAAPAGRRPAPRRSGGEGRVITVFSPKGGVGKSTHLDRSRRRLLPARSSATRS